MGRSSKAYLIIDAFFNSSEVEDVLDYIKDFKTKMIYIERMFQVLRRNDKPFLVLILFDIIISSIIPFIGMYLVKTSIDMLTFGENYSQYFSVVILLLSVSLLANYLQSFISTRSGILGNMIGDKLFRNIFNKTMELDFEVLLDKSILEKRELAMKVIEEGRFNTLTVNFKHFVSNLIVIGGIVYILSSIELWIMSIVVAIVIINSYSTYIRKKAERTIHTDSIPVNRKIQYFWTINSDFAYGKEIRVYNMQDRLNIIHHELVMTIQKYVAKVFMLKFTGNIIFLITNFFLNMAIYLHLGYKIIVMKLINVGDFSLYLSSINTFNNSIQLMVASYIDISNNGQYLKDYFDFLMLECKYFQGIEDVPLHTEDEMIIKFENVTFFYPYNSKPSLKNVNITINSKEKLSIIGENGAGKTTLIKLLLRLFEPTEGRITFNGVDIKTIDYKKYLCLFSTVFQDYRLFAFRISDNIVSLSEKDINEINECLAKTGLQEKVESLEKGVQTYLYKIYEEDGIELSGGESQKLAIARALYKDAPIVILDEPTAALDPKAEFDIYKNFMKLVENKTSVFISHRLSSTRFSDRIIVLKDGLVVETGNHNSLIQKRGYYYQLFNLQAQYYI